MPAKHLTAAVLGPAATSDAAATAQLLDSASRCGPGVGCLAARQAQLFPVAWLAQPCPHDLLAMIWSTSGFCSFAKKRAWMK
jgi:hypothetical protein